MDNTTRKHLAEVAGKAAQIPFHGYMEGKESNLEPVIRFFPNWTLREADGLWCAAFVYYCCREAGFEIPIRPDECKTCHLAGCIAWEELAEGDPRITYHKGGEGFAPDAGDIVLYDRVFENKEHDHIGIVMENRGDTILAAEGNINNKSGIIERPKDAHIRGYIRIPDGYKYRRSTMDYQTENLILHFVTENDLNEVARPSLTCAETMKGIRRAVFIICALQYAGKSIRESPWVGAAWTAAAIRRNRKSSSCWMNRTAVKATAHCV